MTYKKRARSGWNGDKKRSNEKERQYEKEEIRQALEEHEQGEDFRYRRVSRTPNKIKRLEYRIAWYREVDNNWTGRDVFGIWGRNYWSDAAKKLEEKLKKLLMKDK